MIAGYRADDEIRRDQCKDHLRGDSQYLPLAEERVPALCESGEGDTFGGNQRRGLVGVERAERRNQRRDPDHRHQHAVAGAEQHAHDEGDRGGDPHVGAGIDHQPHADPRQPKHRAHGQIDATASAEDDECLAKRQQSDDDTKLADVEDIVDAEEKG